MRALRLMTAAAAACTLIAFGVLGAALVWPSDRDPGCDDICSASDAVALYGYFLGLLFAVISAALAVVWALAALVRHARRRRGG